MSDDLFKKIKSLKNRMPGRNYEVGYGKPPASTRFVKGKSGNPKGRPKGARNKLPALNEERLGDIIMTEAYRLIKVKNGTKTVSIPVAQAVMRSLSIKAVQGDQRSQKVFTDLLRCLIPDFDGAIFSSEWRDALWDRFFTAAPQRQRRSVERYRIVKRA